jgi:hypothetical protein
MINDTTTPKESNAAKLETGGGWMRRLVVHLQSISAAVAMVGEVAWVVLVMLSMIPLFLLTAKSFDETMGEWHIRIFGKTLREKFLHNRELTQPDIV